MKRGALPPFPRWFCNTKHILPPAVFFCVLSVVFLGGSWLRRFCFCLRLCFRLFLLLALSCAFRGSGSLAFGRVLFILSFFVPGCG